MNSVRIDTLLTQGSFVSDEFVGVHYDHEENDAGAPFSPLFLD
jgi:hypothetical protein